METSASAGSPPAGIKLLQQVGLPATLLQERDNATGDGFVDLHLLQSIGTEGPAVAAKVSGDDPDVGDVWRRGKGRGRGKCAFFHQDGRCRTGGEGGGAHAFSGGGDDR